MSNHINYFSITPQLLIKEAEKMGFTTEILHRDKNFFIIRGNGKEKYFKSSDFGENSSLGYKIADDKELTSIILGKNGIKTPQSIYLTKEQVEQFNYNMIDLSYPLVTKPVDQGHGNGVTAYIENQKELNQGIQHALSYGDAVIVQEHIYGDEHRILVLGKKVIMGRKRLPAHVIGDGIHSIKELIFSANNDPLRGEGYTDPLSIITIDDQLIEYIAKKGLTVDSIPPENKHIQLRSISNIGAGGTPINVTDQLSDELKDECIKIAEIVGLPLVGIDIITTDISQSLATSGGAVIEINSNPGFGGDYSILGINTAKLLLEYVFG